MIQAIMQYQFLQHAVLAAILTSIIGGIIGTIIIEKHLVSLSGGIAHVSFGGIGMGYFLGIEPIFGGLIFASSASLAVGQMQRKTGTNADTLISMFWSAGMALGILFIALTPGYPPDLTSYLFGDILTVNLIYLRLMAVLALVVMLAVGLLYNYFKLYLFDEEYAKIMGIPVVVLETILYLLIAFSIVMLIKVVGIILALALLTIPPTTAKIVTNRLSVLMGIGSVLGIIYCMIGLTLSYYFNVPSGATIILVAISVYIIMLFGQKIVGKKKLA